MALSVLIEGIKYKVPEGLALCETWALCPTVGLDVVVTNVTFEDFWLFYLGLSYFAQQWEFYKPIVIHATCIFQICINFLYGHIFAVCFSYLTGLILSFFINLNFCLYFIINSYVQHPITTIIIPSLRLVKTPFVINNSTFTTFCVFHNVFIIQQHLFHIMASILINFIISVKYK